VKYLSINLFFVTLLIFISPTLLGQEFKSQTDAVFVTSAGFAYPNDTDTLLDNKTPDFSFQHFESLRLLNELSLTEKIHFETHLLIDSFHSNYILDSPKTNNHFRITPLHQSIYTHETESIHYQAGSEIDRLNLTANFEKVTLRVGRQPISWGSGRFWQPSDPFGSFYATVLDREYKPGIDILLLDYFPASFSNITLVYALPSKNNNHSAAIRYLQQFSEDFLFTTSFGHVLDETLLTAEIETNWLGAGLRYESKLTWEDESKSINFFSLFGVDYQFENEVILTTEWFHNGTGTSKEENISNLLNQDRYASGLANYISKNILGFSLQRSITPLLSMNYLILVALLKDSTDEIQYSSLHQVTGIYSVSNESDLWLSLLISNGKYASDGVPQSEFGQVLPSVNLRYRIYL